MGENSLAYVPSMMLLGLLFLKRRRTTTIERVACGRFTVRTY
jgi:hypothetical protein